MLDVNPATRLLSSIVEMHNAQTQINREVNQLVPGYGTNPENGVVVVSTLNDVLAMLK